MRCVFCHDKAGIWRSACARCQQVLAVTEESAGRVGWTELVDRFANLGLTRDQVDRVFDTEIDGAPSLRDRLTAEMANVLMRNLGMPGRQSPLDVQRVRRSSLEGSGEGTWAAGQSPPKSGAA